MLPRLLLPGLLMLLVGCSASPPLPVHTTHPSTSTLQGDSGRPPQATWLRTELYFSLGLLNSEKDQANVTRWREFLDKEVTPRFPDGFTALDAYGQWRDKGATQPERLNTRVIVILHENTAKNRDNIEAIRLAWKRVTGDLSVLRLSQPAEISF